MDLAEETNCALAETLLLRSLSLYRFVIEFFQTFNINNLL
jgi:hypothetical protein